MEKSAFFMNNSGLIQEIFSYSEDFEIKGDYREK